MTQIVAIACGASKRPDPSPARELYTGELFQSARRWCERNEYLWVVVSALHGVVQPHREIAPYDFSIRRMTPVERVRWGADCLARLRTLGSPIVLLAPEGYARAIGGDCLRPLRGLGIGYQLQALRSDQRMTELVDAAHTARPRRKVPHNDSALGPVFWTEAGRLHW